MIGPEALRESCAQHLAPGPGVEEHHGIDPPDTRRHQRHAAFPEQRNAGGGRCVIANRQPAHRIVQQYRLHSDALPGVANQRRVTAITYLNDGFEGGETDFPAIGLRVRPVAGDVLLFHSILSGGGADPRARHAGLPVTRGVKWVATRWIRGAPYDPWSPS